MKSLFNTTDSSEVIARINRLTPDTTAQWGKMNCSQMLAHLQQPLRVAFGELKLKRSIIGILFGRMAKKKLVREEPFGKNLPTDKYFVIDRPRDFARERESLLSLVHRFAEAGPGGLSKEPHPFFGNLTANEWDRLMWKHLDHHLRQFGA